MKNVEHRAFDPYGVPTALVANSAGRIVEAISAGLMRDWETGLHFDGQRYMTAASGRYINEAYGGVGLGETNLYLFAGNNPVRERSGQTVFGSRTDPTGGSAPANWSVYRPGGFIDRTAYAISLNHPAQADWLAARSDAEVLGMAVAGSVGLVYGGSKVTVGGAVYLAKNVLVAGIETAIESRIAAYMGDKNFSWGWSMLRNTSINLALGLLPGAAEANAAAKMGRLARYANHYAYQVVANTYADFVWSVGIERRSMMDVLPGSLLGNMGGQLAGDLLISPLMRRLDPLSLFRLCFTGDTVVDLGGDAGSLPLEQVGLNWHVHTGDSRSASERQLEEPNPETWRTVVLQALNEADADIEIKLLRPLKWLKAVHAEVGADIDLEIAELNLAGKAKVLAIEPCSPSGPGTGAVVTGTFRHVAHDLVSVYVEGLAEPIQCTPRHPFWSVTRQTFVAANELQAGEALQMSSGELASVRTVASLSGPLTVYNIEVQGEHVYHVSPLGILVHNASFDDMAVDYAIKKGVLSVESGVNAGVSRTPRHHLFAQTLFGSKASTKAWFASRGVNIDRITVEITQGEHQAIHKFLGSSDWNRELRSRLLRSESALPGNGKLSARQIWNEGYRLLREAGYRDVTFLPYKG